MKAEQWTHFSVVVEDECLWRVTFDSPPINLVTPEMLVELPELISACADPRATRSQPHRGLPRHRCVAADRSARGTLD
jgi:hypothetical protein